MDISSFKNTVRKHLLEYTVFAGTFLFSFLLIHFTHTKYTNDDQFIFYRYVYNLSKGNGFVYNIGQNVLGSTAPLFTLIVTGAKLLFSHTDIPTVTKWTNLFLFSFASVFFYKVCRRLLSFSFSVLAVSVFVLSLSLAIPEAMETSLFILLTFAFLDFLLAGDFMLSAIFVALAILVRPDAGLIALLALVYWSLHVGVKHTAHLVFASILTVLPWLVFSTWYFGSPIPQSLIAKMHLKLAVIEPHFQSVKFILAHASTIYWGNIFNPDHILLQIVCNLVPVGILIGIAVYKKVNTDNWIVFAIPLMYLVMYGIYNPVMFAWYATQMAPLWIITSLIGAEYTYQRISLHVRSNIYQKMFQIIFFCLFLIGPAWVWIKTMKYSDPSSKISLYTASTYLNDHKKPGDTIGLSNIGIVGYYTNAPIIDFIGLVSTGSPQYYPITDGCRGSSLYVVPPQLIEDTQPNWIVAGGDELETCFRQSTWFTGHYRSVYDLGAGGAVWKHL